MSTSINTSYREAVRAVHEAKERSEQLWKLAQEAHGAAEAATCDLEHARAQLEVLREAYENHIANGSEPG